MNKGCFAGPLQNENDLEHSELIFAILEHKKYVRIFIEESQASLVSISLLLKSKTEKIDVSEIFRKIHTLKGSASVLSFEKMTAACNSAEDSLEKFKIAKNQYTLDALQKKCLQIEVALNYFNTYCKDILGKEAMSSEKN